MHWPGPRAITNLRSCADGTPVSADFVIGAYHQLFQIESLSATVTAGSDGQAERGLNVVQAPPKASAAPIAIRSGASPLLKAYPAGVGQRHMRSTPVC